MDDDIWNDFNDLDDLTQKIDYYQKLESKPMPQSNYLFIRLAYI